MYLRYKLDHYKWDLLLRVQDSLDPLNRISRDEGNGCNSTTFSLLIGASVRHYRCMDRLPRVPQALGLPMFARLHSLHAPA